MKRIIHCDQMDFIPGCKAGLKNSKCNPNRLEKKSYKIISIKAEKAFDKTQHMFMIKTLRELGIKENFLNLIKIGLQRNI